MVIFAPSEIIILEPAKKELLELYGNRLRTRVCGICISDNRLLMVRHRFVGRENIFWSPPGGGMQFGESAPLAVIRELKEETGLDVEVAEMLFVSEFIQHPLHAIEVFFRIKSFSGMLATGTDPEFSEKNQIILDVRFMRMDEIKALPKEQVHRIFQRCETLHDLLEIKGYIGT